MSGYCVNQDLRNTSYGLILSSNGLVTCFCVSVALNSHSLYHSSGRARTNRKLSVHPAVITVIRVTGLSPRGLAFTGGLLNGAHR